MELWINHAPLFPYVLGHCNRKKNGKNRKIILTLRKGGSPMENAMSRDHKSACFFYQARFLTPGRLNRRADSTLAKSVYFSDRFVPRGGHAFGLARIGANRAISRIRRQLKVSILQRLRECNTYTAFWRKVGFANFDLSRTHRKVEKGRGPESARNAEFLVFFRSLESTRNSGRPPFFRSIEPKR